MKEFLLKIWKKISVLGILPQDDPATVRLTKTLNRLSVIAALAVLPFAIPALNPTYDSVGWIELISGVGFLSILVANALYRKRSAAFILVLTTNFKIFFSASSRGWDAGEQLFFIPLTAGIVLLYSLRHTMSWLVCGITIAVFITLEITDYQLLLPEGGYPESVIREIFMLNFLLAGIIILAITYYYSRLATQQQNELLATQEEVAIASKAKSEFLSVISHELRTPLHAILNYADLLLETRLTPEQQDIGNNMKSSGKSLSVLVNNILSVSRIDDDIDPPTPGPFDYRSPMLATATTFRPMANQKGLTLSPKILAAPTTVLADEDRISQILALLVENAIKFSESGTITLEARLKLEADADHGELWYEVSDQGRGITQSDLAEIFSPFFMNDRSLNRQHGGLGLGLAICQKLIDSMEGQIHINSTIGQGSTFSIQVPIKLPPQSDNNMSPQTIQATSLDSVNILLVDDHPVNQKIASTMLQKLGYAYEIASDGEEALKTVENGNFHLIFMDIQMPIMDGIESARRIRASLPQDIQPIIIALTANTTEQDKKACFDAGMDDFLAKPVTKSILKNAIDKWIPDLPPLS